MLPILCVMCFTLDYTSMTKLNNKYAARGVSSSPISLRLPQKDHTAAKEIAEEKGVSVNKHASEAYELGVAQMAKKDPRIAEILNNQPTATA